MARAPVQLLLWYSTKVRTSPKEVFVQSIKSTGMTPNTCCIYAIAVIICVRGYNYVGTLATALSSYLS